MQLQGIGKEKWHSVEENQVLRELIASRHGLPLSEVEDRRNFYGENKLPEVIKVTLFQTILHQFINPLIFILLAAALASILIGEITDSIFIFFVIIINSGLGAYQEYNAEKSAEGLKSLLKIKARVKRAGEDVEIGAEEIVPGDIVYLESGMKVPADIRLLEVFNLSVDESFLTGESIANLKNHALIDHDVDLRERSNMAYAGSTVVSGRGMGVVVGTGVMTQVGQISKDVKESTSAKPPLVLRMERFTKQVSIFIVILSVLLGVLLRMGGMDFAGIFFFVVAMAVSAIPEGLPVALTIALSVASNRMSKRNVIVRKLTAVESLGSCTVIASDKTGTLTVNQQTVRKIVLPFKKTFFVSGEGYNGVGEVVEEALLLPVSLHSIDPCLARLNRISVLANEGSLNPKNDQWEYFGDAMDVALLGMSYKIGVDPNDIRREFPIVQQIPYESERKYSAAFWKESGLLHIGIKGAVETVLGFCSRMNDGEVSKPLEKELILFQLEELAQLGHRVLAFAGSPLSDFIRKENYKDEDLPGLEFYGLISFIDPLRQEATEAVVKCKEAGIKVVMITGDHPSTAASIATELGINEEGGKVVTGSLLEGAGPYDSPAYKDLVENATVFARVSPKQKLEIVDVLIRDGEFVAVTGDGVNDAPALKRANIGVAMGSGTDVAKEVGSMIVVDDNFSSIVAGIEEGRYAYDNVRKVIYLLISTGTAEIVMFLISIIAGLPLPLLAVQLLWLNLVTNGIQDVALAFEGGEPGAMQKPPRKPKEKIFNATMINQTVLSGLTIGIIVFTFWYWLNDLGSMGELHARNLVLLLMVFMQNLHAFNCRSEYTSVFKIPISRNYLLVIGIIAAQAIHIISMQIPLMQRVLRIEPISFNEWLQILLLAVPIMIVMELYKFLKNRKAKQ